MIYYDLTNSLDQQRIHFRPILTSYTATEVNNCLEVQSFGLTMQTLDLNKTYLVKFSGMSLVELVSLANANLI